MSSLTFFSKPIPGFLFLTLLSSFLLDESSILYYNYTFILLLVIITLIPSFLLFIFTSIPSALYRSKVSSTRLTIIMLKRKFKYWKWDYLFLVCAQREVLFHIRCNKRYLNTFSSMIWFWGDNCPGYFYNPYRYRSAQSNLKDLYVFLHKINNNLENLYTHSHKINR